MTKLISFHGNPEMNNETYTGGREMMVTDLPGFMRRPVTVADITPGSPEHEARESYRKAIEEQYLWELEREELRRFKTGVFRAAKSFAMGAAMVTVLVVAVIAFGYLIGA